MPTQTTFTLSEIANLLDAKLFGDPDYRISSVADLESAGAEDLSFFAVPSFGKSRHEAAFVSSHAGAILIADEARVDNKRNYLLTEDPSLAFQQLAVQFLKHKRRPSGFAPIHPSAVIHDSVKLGQDVRIGPHVVIDQGCQIGNNVQIEAGSVIGPDVFIGDDSHLHPNVTIEASCQIGARVIIQSAAVIGACGFGYSTDKQGVHHKLEQLGNVVIEDDVHIGATTCIDRARFKTTRIGRGTKIGNQVQVAHGVQTGAHCMLISHVGLSGSVKLGNHVILAGSTGVTDHIKICDGVIAAAGSGIMKDIDKPGKYGGVPSIPVKEAMRLEIHRQRLPAYADKLKELEQRLAALEES